MSIFFLILFLTGLNLQNTRAITVSEVRLMYKNAATDENACKQLISRLAPYNEKNNPVFFGYKGCATMIMAKHAFNPLTKLSRFKNGRNMLESAISADKKNVELRFLRYTVQTNAPGFLGYHDQIKSDKQFLLASLPRITDAELKNIIISYLKYSDQFSEHEKKQLK